MLRVAADLFHRQGVRATSPEAVIEASATGKGQFYHYFGSKEGLVHQVLQSHLQAIRNGTAPLSYEITSWAALEQWFTAQLALQVRYDMTRGCPFGTIGNEVTERDELIRQDLSLIFEVIKHKLVVFFVRERAQGRLADGADEADLADFCLAAIQGGMLLGKVKRDRSAVATVIAQTLAHLRRYIVRIEEEAQ